MPAPEHLSRLVLTCIRRGADRLASGRRSRQIFFLFSSSLAFVCQRWQNSQWWAKVVVWMFPIIWVWLVVRGEDLRVMGLGANCLGEGENWRWFFGGIRPRIPLCFSRELQMRVRANARLEMMAKGALGWAESRCRTVGTARLSQGMRLTHDHHAPQRTDSAPVLPHQPHPPPTTTKLWWTSGVCRAPNPIRHIHCRAGFTADLLPIPRRGASFLDAFP